MLDRASRPLSRCLFPLVALVAALVSLSSSAARAQPGLAEARALAQCLHDADDRIQRSLRLLEQAEARAAQPGLAEDVRRDARASVEVLIDRIREQAEEARRCHDASRIPVRSEGVTIQGRPDDPARDALSRDDGTVPVVQRDTALGRGVVVVRGERVDGTGTAPDAEVQAAVRRAGPAIVACYDQLVARGSRRGGELVVTFRASDARSVQATVERSFDSTLAGCVTRAVSGMRIEGQRGPSVYSYLLRFTP